MKAVIKGSSSGRRSDVSSHPPTDSLGATWSNDDPDITVIISSYNEMHFSTAKYLSLALLFYNLPNLTHI